MEKISERQLILIGIAFCLHSSLLTLPNAVFQTAYSDAWMCYLLAAVVIVLPLWLLGAVMKRFPDSDLFTVLKDRHPVVGRAVGLLFVFFYFLILCRDIRLLADFTDNTLLRDTPLVITALLLMSCILFLGRSSLDVLARMNGLWLPFVLVIFVLLPVVLTRDFELHNILPVFENGTRSVLLGSWYVTAYLGEIIIMPLIASNRTFRFRNGLISLVIGTLLLALLNLYTLLELGPHIVSRLTYPFYELARQIRLTDFLDRLELPLIAIELPAMITKAGISLFVICFGLNRLFPKLAVKELALPFATLSYVCSFLFFKSVIQMIIINRSWPAIALIFELVIPILLFFFLRKPKSDWNSSPH